jgi:hypothetical protein
MNGGRQAPQRPDGKAPMRISAPAASLFGASAGFFVCMLPLLRDADWVLICPTWQLVNA